MLSKNEETWAKRKCRANAARRIAYALKHRDARLSRLRQREERLAAERAQAERISEARLKQQKSPAQVRRDYRGAARKMLALLKKGPCSDCGNYYPPEAMDFDHRDPELKLVAVSKAIKLGINRLVEEAAKCDLVCSNCHRVRTARRRDGLPAVLPPPEYHI